jgi:hypothetical protein
MAYRLYCGIAESQQQFLALRARWNAYSYVDLDDALRMAFAMEKTPNRPWEIEGDDGTSLDREKLKQIFRDRGHELVGGPKVR